MEAIDFSQDPLTPADIEGMSEAGLDPNVVADAVQWRQTSVEQTGQAQPHSILSEIIEYSADFL